MKIKLGIIALIYVLGVLAGICILRDHIVVVFICAFFGGLFGATLLLLDRE